MPARTGEQYLQGLRERHPEVWVGGQRVKDVTTHQGFANGARSVAALYDMQHDPALVEEMTFASPTTGDRVGLSFLSPRNLEDLENRRRMFLPLGDMARRNDGPYPRLHERRLCRHGLGSSLL